MLIPKKKMHLVSAYLDYCGSFLVQSVIMFLCPAFELEMHAFFLYTSIQSIINVTSEL
jgi:hypothetical protein